MIPTDISSHAISTISINKDYVRLYPHTVDATPLNYNSFIPERTGNNSLNSTFINDNNLNGTKNLTQQAIQTPSHFAKKRICWNNNNNRSTTKQFAYPTQLYNSKTKKSKATTTNHTVHSETLCCTKIFTNGLSNVHTSTKTLIQTTNIT